MCREESIVKKSMTSGENIKINTSRDFNIESNETSAEMNSVPERLVKETLANAKTEIKSSLAQKSISESPSPPKRESVGNVLDAERGKNVPIVRNGQATSGTPFSNAVANEVVSKQPVVVHEELDKNELRINRESQQKSDFSGTIHTMNETITSLNAAMKKDEEQLRELEVELAVQNYKVLMLHSPAALSEV